MELKKIQNLKRRSKSNSMKIIGLIILIVVVLIVIVIGIYFYKCIHYWQTDYKKTIKAGFIEKQVTLSDGSVINYAEGPDNGKALLLIHGQTGSWEDYTRVLPNLCENHHVFAVDCYGHGNSTHKESKYYLNENGDDLIWFVDQVIGKETIVSGHSSGGLLASYIAAYGNDNVVGAVLEDPPVFSTEQENFEKTFAYHDTYKNMHDYINSVQEECWEAYYMRNSLWGKLYMPSAMKGLANYAQKSCEKHPDDPVQYFFLPESINALFLFTKEYDLAFGDNFYDYSWHADIEHEKMMEDIHVPTILLHSKDSFTEDGILQAASSDEQARRACKLIGDCNLIEFSTNHNIHRFKPEQFIMAVNKLK